MLDSSGIRLHYTPALRSHDAALMVAGIAVSALHVIPPAQKEYKTVGICSSECTEGVSTICPTGEVGLSIFFGLIFLFINT